MVMVPDAGKMHFRHSDQQNSSGGGPRRMDFATSVLAGSGSTRHGLPPKPKILATPLSSYPFAHKSREHCTGGALPLSFLMSEDRRSPSRTPKISTCFCLLHTEHNL